MGKNRFINEMRFIAAERAFLSARALEPFYWQADFCSGARLDAEGKTDALFLLKNSLNAVIMSGQEIHAQRRNESLSPYEQAILAYSRSA